MKQLVILFMTLTIGTFANSIADATVEIVTVAGGATGVGDGGTGVVCTSETGFVSTELLDLYEAKRFHSVQFDFVFGEGSYREEIEKLQGAFEFFTGDESFRDSFFFAETAVIQFRDRVADSFDVMPLSILLEPNCVLFPIGYRYGDFARAIVEIDRNVWNQMTSRERALLMIHEALHTRFPKGAVGSSALRQVVAYMAAPDDFKSSNVGLIREVIRTQRPALKFH